MKIVIMDKVQRADKDPWLYGSPRITRKLVIIEDDLKPRVLRSSKSEFWDKNIDVGKGW